MICGIILILHDNF